MNTYTLRNLLLGKAPTRGNVYFLSEVAVSSLLTGAVVGNLEAIPDVTDDKLWSFSDSFNGYGEWYCSDKVSGFSSNGREWLQMLNFDQYISRGSVVGGINIALLSEIGGN